jgi:lauroyl/myristoyl acyltransferase
VNVKGIGLRRLAYAGARYGPPSLVRYSPVFWGTLFAALLPDLRDTVRGNLRRLRGPRPRVREDLDVVRTFVAYAHCLAESLAAERPEAAKAVPSVEGAEHLAEAIARGRGVVLVTAHTGTWDVAARFLGREYGMDVVLVMAKEEDERARALHDRVRSKGGGLRVIHVGAHPLDALPLLGHLRSGGVIAAQLDRTLGAETSLDVSLGGEPFRVPEGPFRLAALSGAPVVPAFVRRLGYFRYEIRVCPALALSRRPAPEEVLGAARRATADMEQFLLENPTRWFHFRR